MLGAALVRRLRLACVGRHRRGLGRHRCGRGSRFQLHLQVVLLVHLSLKDKLQIERQSDESENDGNGALAVLEHIDCCADDESDAEGEVRHGTAVHRLEWQTVDQPAAPEAHHSPGESADDGDDDERDFQFRVLHVLISACSSEDLIGSGALAQDLRFDVDGCDMELDVVFEQSFHLADCHLSIFVEVLTVGDEQHVCHITAVFVLAHIVAGHLQSPQDIGAVIAGCSRHQLVDEDASLIRRGDFDELALFTIKQTQHVRRFAVDSFGKQTDRDAARPAMAGHTVLHHLGHRV